MNTDKTKKKLKKLEEKFNLAVDILDELPLVVIPEEEVESVDVEVVPDAPTQKIPEPVFELSMLKEDFLLVRAQLKKLVNSGQNILSQANVIDIADMKSSQLESLAAIQTVIGNNLKLLIDIYEKISKIEKMQSPMDQPVTPVASGGTYVDKQIVFNGSTSDLLKMMSEKTNEA